VVIKNLDLDQDAPTGFGSGFSESATRLQSTGTIFGLKAIVKDVAGFSVAVWWFPGFLRTEIRLPLTPLHFFMS
jgi:hypothetical protein